MVIELFFRYTGRYSAHGCVSFSTRVNTTVLHYSLFEKSQSLHILAYADEDSIEIYNPDESEPLFTIAVDEAKDIEWSPDGTQIAAISRDGELLIWDVPL